MQRPVGLTALEAASGFPLGGRARPAPSLGRLGENPRDALAAVMARALEAGPLAVAFSGGRDSSLLLAVAADVCRRAGADPPLPITICFADGAPEADERIWQTRVIDRLKIAGWQRLPLEGELDFIGPYARPHLLAHGPLFPANAHSVIPIIEAACDRCVIVGLGGDELFSPHQWWPVHELLGRRRRVAARDVRRLAASAIPRSLRGLTRRSPREFLDALHWLTPAARGRLEREFRRAVEEPILWRSALTDAASRRDVILPLLTMQRLAGATGGRVLAPLLDERFVGALARAGGRAGWGTRAAAMQVVAGDLLPAEVLQRKRKASFNRVFFGEESRAFAAAWSGHGVDESLVDAEALRREWLSPVPDFRTASLLQSTWLEERLTAGATSA